MHKKSVYFVGICSCLQLVKNNAVQIVQFDFSGIDKSFLVVPSVYSVDRIERVNGR